VTVPPLSIVVALAENGVIGRGNALPWRLRTDLRRFRDLTWGKPMIMGRKCWDAIGRPLPGRATVLMTRDPGVAPEGAHVARSWEDAKRTAQHLAATMGAAEIAVVGGAEIYRLALPETSRMHLTRVHDLTPGDVVFPAFRADEFRETFREEHPAGEGDQHPFTFIDLQRR
jgi:dihydrofolate reductase